MATSTSGPGRKRTTSAAREATTTKAAARSPRTPDPAETVDAPPAAPPVPEPTVVEESKPEVAGPILKKPELIARVIAETGMKKKDVRPVVDAMLNVLGLGLANGEDMNLPPLGKVRVNRTKEVANARVLVTKVRQPHARPPTRKDPLADAGE